MPRKNESLKNAIGSLLSVYKRLRELERDVKGFERQVAAIPREVVSTISVLDDLETRLTERFIELVGEAPPQHPAVATGEAVREVLKTIEAVARLSGAQEFDLGPLPTKTWPIWTDDPEFYVTEEGSRNRLAFSPERPIKLRDDGSMVGYDTLDGEALDEPAQVVRVRV